MLRAMLPATRGFSLLAICLLGLASCSDEAQRDPELRRELLEMRDADQAERTGQAVGGMVTDRARAERLKEIIAEHGWPTVDLVGRTAPAPFG